MIKHMSALKEFCLNCSMSNIKPSGKSIFNIKDLFFVLPHLILPNYAFLLQKAINILTGEGCLLVMVEIQDINLAFTL